MNALGAYKIALINRASGINKAINWLDNEITSRIKKAVEEGSLRAVIPCDGSPKESIEAVLNKYKLLGYMKLHGVYNVRC